MKSCASFFLFIGLLTSSLSGEISFSESKEFFSSFINHYDFRVEGRFTHEYHPFLLKKTAKSFDVLHERLKDEGMNLAGHIIISGYEANAIPSYYLNFKNRKINDEMSSEGREGWSIRLHNRFGLMTGYLFRNFNEYAHKWASTRQFPFVHINPFEVELFREEMNIFQRHAFGDAFDYLQEMEVNVARDFKANDTKKMLDHLIAFWTRLYESEVTLTGNLSAATQDILFSIEYGNFLKRSPLPFKAYYMGGDITYPIETSVKQHTEATKNAQDFVRLFAPTLTPVNNKKTAYVFSSFVDGVGKSTMLGNIKNWIKHGNNLEKYERVDNSSSQYAEVFEFSKDVFIADLPAQVSHFTYKPDGLVYVDAATELSNEELDSMAAFVRTHHDKLIEAFESNYEKVITILKQEGFFSKILNDANNPSYAFLKNLLLLKRVETNLWVPFTYKSYHGLFISNDESGKQLRILRPLSGAASHGLKNIESEQMFFFDGIRFPLSYKVFLEDLTTQLKKNGIEEIVFVNFTSMYPRSCRENIRINYLLQQMALIDPQFSPEESLYKQFVNPSALYGSMMDRHRSKSLYSAFMLEAYIRYSLYVLLADQERNNLNGLSMVELTSYIEKNYKQLKADSGYNKLVSSLLDEKCHRELHNLEERFGLTKEFVNIQQFSFEDVELFSRILHSLFTEAMEDAHLKELWENLEGEVASRPTVQGYSNKISQLQNGLHVLIKYEYPLGFKDEKYLTTCLRMLRAAWYASLGNILYGYEKYPVPPTLVKIDENAHVYVIQKLLDEWKDETSQLKLPPQFHLNKKVPWGEFQNVSYCLQWECNETNTGIYGFGIDETAKRNQGFAHSIISKQLMDYKQENGALRVMPTSLLVEQLNGSPEWEREQAMVLKNAQNNGTFSGEIKVKNKNFLGQSNGVSVLPHLGREQHKEAARLLIRLLATLEMILKDPDADIVVRRGNKKDFKAALLLFEKVTLPNYYGIVFERPLFDNYDQVEPLISWEDLKS